MNINAKTVPNFEIKKRHGFSGADWWWVVDLFCEPCGHTVVLTEKSPNPRCPTCHSLLEHQDRLEVRVAAELTDWRARAALQVHEITEALFCKHLGITVKQVDDYDAKFEAEHPEDGTTNVGDRPDCPYRVPHNYATAAERIVTGVLDVSWQEYDDRLADL